MNSETEGKIDSGRPPWRNLSLTSKCNQSASMVTSKALSLTETAFSFEKILKTIFSFLRPRDLLQCRLVSSSWLRMATKDQLYIIRIWQELRIVKDLSEFLDDLGSHSRLLPCSGIRILDMTLPPIYFSKLFSRHGCLVKHLHVKFATFDLGELKCISFPLDSLLEFVTKLLTEQMPNLSTLIVEFELNPNFTREIEPQVLAMIKERVYCAGKQNQNLRMIQFDTQTPYEIIEAVCCLAPKVEQLHVDCMRFWMENKHLGHLLKEVDVRPYEEFWSKQKSIKDFVKIVEHADVKRLRTNFSCVRDSPKLWAHLSILLTRIFKKCCHSLEKLHLERVYFLPGTVLPRMPKVKLLYLSPNFFVSSPSPECVFLPNGTSIATTFPTLITLVIQENGVVPDVTSVTNFLALCKNDELTSVKRIYTFGCGEDQKVFQRNFPNAVVIMTE